MVLSGFIAAVWGRGWPCGPCFFRASGFWCSRLKNSTTGNDIHAKVAHRPVSRPRAFLFAGARSVLSTAVLADEGAAIRLVDLFREELAAGHPTDVALQRAKLAYLQRYTLPEEQLPIHWAGWQIHGEGMAVEAPRPWWPWLLAVALLGGMAVVWGWGRKLR